MTSTEQVSPLERFIKIFLLLDRDGNGVIDRNELLDYCRREKISSTEASEFMSKFDYDKDNKVSLEEFCRGLGLNKDDMIKARNRLMKIEKEGKPQLPDKIQIISTTMDDIKVLEITKMFKDMMDRAGKTPDMPKLLSDFKNRLDDSYGRVWQVVILTGSYAMSFCHEPFQSLQFKHNDHICLAWKTPSG